MRLTLFFFYILYFSFPCHSQNLKIEVIGIKNIKGQLLIGVYTNKENYDAKQPIIWKAYSKEKVIDGRLTATLENLTPKTYGIALMDDEDTNWKMNFSFFIPSEGFAFSNYYHKGITQPTFDDFKFDFKNEDKTVIMKMRYI